MLNNSESNSQASSYLAKWDNARQIIAEIHTVDEIKQVRDKAEALRLYAKKAGETLEVQNDLAEIKLRSERRAGELLQEIPRQEAGRPEKWSHDATIFKPRLSDVGISKSQSSRFQKIAGIPVAAFELHIEQTKNKSDELTTVGMLKLAKAIQRERQLEDEQNRAMESAQGGEKGWIVTGDQAVVQSDLVITDPPYGILEETWEPDDLEAFTRNWAVQWNASGADYIGLFWSQEYLFTGKQWFDESLSHYAFQQLLIWHYPNNKKPSDRQGFKRTWEPLFLYRRTDSDKEVRVGAGDWGKELTDFDCHVAAVPQTNFKGVETKQHPAQKPLSVMRWLVNALSRPGELVCDPFCGSGTTGVAAIQLGRRFHGIECDVEYRALAERRIVAYGMPLSWGGNQRIDVQRTDRP